MTVDVVSATTPLPKANQSQRPSVLRALLKKPLTVAALLVLVIFVVVGFLSPVIAPLPPNRVVLTLTNAPPFSGEYFLGGDMYGRDIWSRLIRSTTGALWAALILTAVASVVGVATGLLAGFFGKWIDGFFSWVFSVIMAAPGVILLISIYTLLGATMPVAMGVFGVLVAPTLYWVVRTLTREVRNELYVDAARVAGLSNARIVGRHVLVAIRAPVILVVASLGGTGIAIQAGLEFLGLGDPNIPSWGGMLTVAFSNIYIAPVQMLWPALALGIVTGGFTLVSIGLRDVLEGTKTAPRRVRTRRRVEFDAPPGAGEMTGGTSEAPLLEIENLRVVYGTSEREQVAVSDVSLVVRAGEIVGVVGESGSGKTQTVFATLGLLPAQATTPRGSIRFAGRELLEASEAELCSIRGRDIGYIPQEPVSNLDPTFTVGTQLVFAIRAQSQRTRAEAKALALSMLEHVGIRNPDRVYKMYPHQISGGMAQRVLIAGAVANSPRLLLADEPTTALDVTIQAEVLDLLRDLQKESGMGVLIVTHNFGVVADLCDRVVVMQTGQVVEEGPVDKVFRSPQHPYTQQLLSSVLEDGLSTSALERELND